MVNIDYDGNDNENYSLMLNQIPFAALLLGEDEAKELTDDVRTFIEMEADFTLDGCMIGIRNNDEMSGVIVDITDQDQDTIIAEKEYYFKNYRN